MLEAFNISGLEWGEPEQVDAVSTWGTPLIIMHMKHHIVPALDGEAARGRHRECGQSVSKAAGMKKQLAAVLEFRVKSKHGRNVVSKQFHGVAVLPRVSSTGRPGFTHESFATVAVTVMNPKPFC